MAKPHMSPLMIEYLILACEVALGDLEKQVDAVELRKRLHFSLAEDRTAQRGLEFRDYITTKGAGPVSNERFFWITEEGVQAAIREGEMSGWARWFREGREEDDSGEGLKRNLRWVLTGKFEEIANPEKTPLESEMLYELLVAKGWDIPAGVMSAFFADLENQGIIRSYTVADRGEVEKHGGRKIWALDEEGLNNWRHD